MARIMIQYTNKTVDVHTTVEVRGDERQALREAYDRNPMIRLYEILPATLRERQTWGRGMSGAGETFMRAAGV